MGLIHNIRGYCPGRRVCSQSNCVSGSSEHVADFEKDIQWLRTTKMITDDIADVLNTIVETPPIKQRVKHTHAVDSTLARSSPATPTTFLVHVLT